MNRRKILSLDMKEPWGVSPFFFGTIQGIWGILMLIFWLASSLAGHGSLLWSLIIGLIPTWILMGHKLRREYKYGWLINPLIYVSQSNNMIAYRKPLYRTIFGYLRAEAAPLFDVYHLSNGDYEIVFRAMGCPHSDADLLHFLQRELPGYFVYLKDNLPLTLVVSKKNRNGRNLNNGDFI